MKLLLSNVSVRVQFQKLETPGVLWNNGLLEQLDVTQLWDKLEIRFRMKKLVGQNKVSRQPS